MANLTYRCVEKRDDGEKSLLPEAIRTLENTTRN